MRYLQRALLLVFAPAYLFGQIDFSTARDLQNPLFREMDRQVREGKYGKITSILIAKDGKLAFEAYYNGTDSLSLRNTRSATKSLATILMGIAIQQGYIASEKELLFKYVHPSKPLENPDPRKMEITLEDLLTMSSLLECDDNNPYSRGNEERMYLIEDWLQFFLDLPIRAFTFDPKPEDMPYGRSMSYCSAGAAALAFVLENAVHAPLQEYAAKNLFGPLHIGDYHLHTTPTGTLNTAGGSEYRSRDFLKMIQLLLQKGRWGNRQLMPSDWVARATTPHVNARPGTDYGYLLWLKSYGKDRKYACFAMAGNGGQKIAAIPDLGVSIVITTVNYGNPKAHDYTDEILDRYVVPAMAD